jgi:hypothetical protein
LKEDSAHGNRWIAYFDILGFKNMLHNFNREHGNNLGVFVDIYYKNVIGNLKKSGEYNPEKVSIAWFSDTFLFFSHDDTKEAFLAIESAARHFFIRTMRQQMPLRGAVGFGEFYGDIKNSIFIGQGLIDAYQYAECQDWIGFIISPSVYKELEKTNSNSLLRSNYIQYEVPFKKNKSEQLHACRLQISPKIARGILNAICNMRGQAEDNYPDKYATRYKKKYEKTIAFWT